MIKVITNPDKELVAEIRARIKANNGHCACVLPNNYNNDTVCMCKKFKEQLERGEPGECHCGLYIITND